MEHTDQTKRIDFTNSNLSWGGRSRGIFNLVSVLTMQHDGDETGTNTYGLGQSVLAGNMYSEKELLKQPPYLFQVAGSTSEQRIYRTLISNRHKRNAPDWMKNDKTGDTYGEPLFKEFQLDIRNESAFIVTGYDEVEASFPRNGFSAKIYFNVGKHTACLEFPINHINIKPEVRMWQVETGPVLFPVVIKEESLFEYLPSFVHFNGLEKLDVFYDYPYGIRLVNLQGKGIIEGFPCTIELFSN